MIDEPRGCPIPGACSALAELAALRTRADELETRLTAMRADLVSARSAALMEAKAACMSAALSYPVDDFNGFRRQGAGHCFDAIEALLAQGGPP